MSIGNSNGIVKVAKWECPERAYFGSGTSYRKKSIPKFEMPLDLENSLEHCLNSGPISAGDLLLIYQETHSNNNYMMLFPMPDVSKEKMIVNWDGRGLMNRDGEDLYLVWIEGPPLKGYKITEYRNQGKFGWSCACKSAQDKLFLHDCVRHNDKFVIAYGLKGISHFMAGLALKQTGVNPENFHPMLLEILERIHEEEIVYNTIL